MDFKEVSRNGSILRHYAYDAFGNRTVKEDYSGQQRRRTAKGIYFIIGIAAGLTGCTNEQEYKFLLVNSVLISSENKKN